MLPFVAGLVVGSALAAVLGVVVARRSMIEVRTSPLGFDETVAALERGIADTHGWASPGTRNLNDMLHKRGVDLAPRVTLVEACNPGYARDVLTDDRRMATLMPCALAVYEDDHGRVHVSKMNTGLMGRVFGGTVARVMGGLVSREERDILAALDHEPTGKVVGHPGAGSNP